jgi:hypothetical protein
MANGVYTIVASLLSYYFLRQSIGIPYVLSFLVGTSFLAFTLHPFIFNGAQDIQLFTYYLMYVGGYLLVSYLLYRHEHFYIRWMATVCYGIGILIYDTLLLWQMETTVITEYYVHYQLYIKVTQLVLYGGMVGFITIIQQNKIAIEQQLSEYIHRVALYNNQLIVTSKNRLVHSGDIEQALREIILAGASVIPCSRISIWEIDEKHAYLSLKVGYDTVTQSFFTEAPIPLDSVPAYRTALLEEEIIEAVDARQDSRTSAFNDDYFKRTGVVSLMDTPYFIDNKLKGVICCEEYRHLHDWEKTEELFSLSLGKLISIAYYCMNNRHYLKEVMNHNHTLKEVNEHITSIYGNLEKELVVKNSELESLKGHLSDLSLRNDHQVRGPLCRIQGLINLYKMDKDPLNQEKYIDLLDQSTKELDTILKEMNAAVSGKI